MRMQAFGFLAVLCTFIASSSLWSQSASDIFILDKSIDVLTRARNFRVDETIPASRNGNLTVIRRVSGEDPSWWPQGVAIQVLSVNGRERRPVKTVYVAKRWFDRGTRQGDLSHLQDPQEVQQQVLSALTPVVPECEVQVNEPEYEAPREPARPARHDTYTTLAQLVQSGRTPRDCHNKLRTWYRRHSMWKDLSRKQRAELIIDKAHTISTNMRVDGLVDTCARALGRTDRASIDEIKAFMTTRLSASEKARINVTNYEANCRRYFVEYGGGQINTSLFRERINDPQSIHPEFDPSLAVCIIKRETSSTDFDPHSMNYSFCQLRGRQGRPRSTAHGLGQFTQTTFLSLRESGVMPLSSISDSTSRSTNRVNFRNMSTDPDMQIESIFRYINYLMKAPSSARIRNMHNQVYNDSIEDWEKAVISYDQDRASDYIRGVHACRRCFGRAGNDRSAQADCLSGN